jgi:hypothetical protein
MWAPTYRLAQHLASLLTGHLVNSSIPSSLCLLVLRTSLTVSISSLSLPGCQLERPSAAWAITLIKISWDSSLMAYLASLVSALTLFPLVRPRFCIVRLVSISQPFITLMMETVGIYETSANFNQTSLLNIPDALCNIPVCYLILCSDFIFYVIDNLGISYDY